MTDPVFDNSQAILEGWSIFDCDGSDNGRWQLQKCDDSGVFKNDFEAWDFVKDRAQSGSTYHIMTLLFLETYSPLEFQALKGWRCNVCIA